MKSIGWGWVLVVVVVVYYMSALVNKKTIDESGCIKFLSFIYYSLLLCSPTFRLPRNLLMLIKFRLSFSVSQSVSQSVSKSDSHVNQHCFPRQLVKHAISHSSNQHLKILSPSVSQWVSQSEFLKISADDVDEQPPTHPL